MPEGGGRGGALAEVRLIGCDWLRDGSIVLFFGQSLQAGSGSSSGIFQYKNSVEFIQDISFFNWN